MKLGLSRASLESLRFGVNTEVYPFTFQSFPHGTMIPDFALTADLAGLPIVRCAPLEGVPRRNFPVDRMPSHSEGIILNGSSLPEARHLASVSVFFLQAHLLQNFLRVLISSASIEDRPEPGKAGNQQKTDIEWIHLILLKS